MTGILRSYRGKPFYQKGFPPDPSSKLSKYQVAMELPLILSRNEDNYFGLMRLLAQTRYVNLHRQDGLEWVEPCVSPWPQGVFLCNAGNDAHGMVRDTAGRIRAGALPDKWITSPISRPELLLPALEAEGFRETTRWPAMLLEPTNLMNNGENTPELTISEGCDLPALLEFSSMVLRKPGTDTGTVNFAKMFHHAIGAFPESFRLFLGNAGGLPVSAALLFMANNIAGIYWVATLPDHRGRGFGTAVTRCAVRAGFQAGCSCCVLHATAMGEPIYRKLGFNRMFDYRVFRLEQPEAKGSA